MLPQLPEDHKLKSDLHSTLPLASICGVIGQSLHWTVAVLLVVDMAWVVEVVVELYMLDAPKKVTLLGVQVG